MKLKQLRGPVLVMAATGLIIVSSLAAAPAQHPINRHSACRTEQAVGMPAWVTSGVELNGRFLVVDVIRQRLVEISHSGVADALRSAFGEFVADKGIVRVWQDPEKNGDSFLAEFDNGRVLDVNRKLVPAGGFEVLTEGRASSGFQIATIFNSTLVQGPNNAAEVFGYADLTEGDPQTAPPSKWWVGFVRVLVARSNSHQKEDSFELIQKWSFPGDQRTLMKLTYPFVASIGQTVYALSQEGNRLELKALEPGNNNEFRSMGAFPGRLKGELAPMLPSFARIQEYVRTMKVAEESTMPVGLYAWKNELYMLFRTYERTAGRSERRWFISKIDPQHDVVRWTVQVPGSSPHMMAIPGNTEWAFLAKGSVVGGATQAIEQVQFVSSEQLKRDRLTSLCY